MDLQREYGPIIRISPYEINIADPDFYDTLYSSSLATRKYRWSWYTAGLGLPDSTLGTVEQALHRRRRAALSPFFSKQNVRKLQPVVEERVVTVASRLEQLAATGEIVPINLAFSAFSNEVVTQYSFGQSNHRIEAEGFDPTYHHNSYTAGTSNALMRHMNWILRITLALPEKLAMKLSAEAASFVVQRREHIDQIDEIRGQPKGTDKDNEGATIFHSLLNSDLPLIEKTSIRLAQEAVLLVGAGTHTTSWAMSVATFHLLSQPCTLRKLETELEKAIPDPAISTPLHYKD